MLKRFAFAGAILLTVGASSAFAAPIIPFGWLATACAHLGNSSQCAVQLDVDGHKDVAFTQQVLEQDGYQVAGTDQEGGSNNHAFTYQNGTNQVSSTVQTGNGGWSATSSIGSSTTTSVSLSSN